MLIYGIEICSRVWLPWVLAKTLTRNTYYYIIELLFIAQRMITLDNTELEKVEGEVTDIIFGNDDNGYKVIEVENETDNFIAVGYMHGLSVGEYVILTGRWTNHSVYGEQFKAEMFEKRMPCSRETVYRYLASGIIKGIRESTAKKIVEKFGEKSLEIIAKDPMKLATINGISKSKAIAVHESYNEQVGASNLVMFLQGFNISVNYAAKIFKTLGTAAVDLIEANPYMLCDTIDGISFKTSDDIAERLNFPRDSELRLKAGTVYTLKYNTRFGHSYLPRETLCSLSGKLMHVSAGEVDGVIGLLEADGHFVCETVGGEKRVYCISHYRCEENVAKKICSLSRVKYDCDEDDIRRQIDISEKKRGMKLAALQRDAVECALKNSVLVITGGPGTGKTTIINAIIDVMHMGGLSVTLTAPTGRAAKRMSQVCKTEAKTIHRLLEAGFHDESDEPEFGIDEDKPIDSDVIIIDEMSMVDVVLMSSLLRAVKDGTRLIMVGDVNQLPSVGPGNVLKDIIDSGVVSVIRLTEIFRQAKESMIVVNAHNVNSGVYPQCNVKDKDFFFASFSDAHNGFEYIMSLCSTRLTHKYGYEPFDIQVLSPSKKGICGVYNLNSGLQSVLNPPSDEKKEKKYGDLIFREGDKVMQIKNNYDIAWTTDDGTAGSGVFNGDVGIIDKISEKFSTLSVRYDERKVVYDFRDLDEIDLAYAVTVHKSQGSEFPAIIIPLYDAPYMLISRNLFYTGITRARDLVVLVGREDIMRKMVDNNKENRRYSGLKEKIILEAKNADS